MCDLNSAIDLVVHQLPGARDDRGGIWRHQQCLPYHVTQGFHELFQKVLPSVEVVGYNTKRRDISCESGHGT